MFFIVIHICLAKIVELSDLTLDPTTNLSDKNSDLWIIAFISDNDPHMLELL